MDKRKQAFVDTINQQAQIEDIYEKKMQQAQYNISQVVPIERTVEEQLNDLLRLKQEAFKALSRVVNNEIASEFLSKLGDEELIVFNQGMSGFIPEVSRLWMVDATFLKTLYDRYMLRFEKTHGISIPLEAADVLEQEGENPLDQARREARDAIDVRAAIRADEILQRRYEPNPAVRRPHEDMLLGRPRRRVRYAQEEEPVIVEEAPPLPRLIDIGVKRPHDDMLLERPRRRMRETQEEEQGPRLIDIGVKRPSERELRGPPRQRLRADNLDQARRDASEEVQRRANQRADQILGRGLSRSKKEVAKYAPFGKYLIHLPSLQDSIMNIKFQSKANHPQIPRTQISAHLKHILEKALAEGRIAPTNKLTEGEMRLLVKACELAQVEHPFHFPGDDEELERFEILRGEISAGNDNPDIVKELKRLLVKFMADGRISRRQANNVMYELTCI